MSVAVDPKYTTEQAAEYLGVEAQTLRVWRTTKRYGLPYLKIGGSVRYALSDLNKWLQSRRVEPVTA